MIVYIRLIESTDVPNAVYTIMGVYATQEEALTPVVGEDNWIVQKWDVSTNLCTDEWMWTEGAWHHV